jgi:hypothetical protein
VQKCEKGGWLKKWPEAATNKSLMDLIWDEVQLIQDTTQQGDQERV